MRRGGRKSKRRRRKQQEGGNKTREEEEEGPHAVQVNCTPCCNSSPFVVQDGRLPPRNPM